jgi:hypothetical protein
LINDLNINKIKEEARGEELVESSNNDADDVNIDFLDIGRIHLDRKKQKEGIEGLKIAYDSSRANNSIIKPIFAGAAISGLFAIFRDDDNYFRIKNIPDNEESRQLLYDLGFKQVNGDVQSMKITAMDSLAKSDKRSNVV